jgi:hypothetical protein
MAVQKVTAVKASWAQTINGVAFAKDQTLTGAQVRAIAHLDAYLSSGALYTVPDRYARRAGGSGRPYKVTSLNPQQVREL